MDPGSGRRSSQLPRSLRHGPERRRLTILESLDTLLQHRPKPLGTGTHERTDEPHVRAHELVVHRRPGDSEDRFDERRVRLVQLGDDVGEGIEPDAELGRGRREGR